MDSLTSGGQSVWPLCVSFCSLPLSSTAAEVQQWQWQQMNIDQRLIICPVPNCHCSSITRLSRKLFFFFQFLLTRAIVVGCRKRRNNKTWLHCNAFLAYAFLFLSSVPTGETHQRTTKAAAKKKNINSFMLAGKKVGENGQQQKGGGKSESTKDKKNKREKGGSYCK